MKYAMLVVLLLSACGGTIEQSAPQSGTCGADAYQDLIGKDAAAAIALPEPKRAYRQDEAVTMDFNPARINIQLDNTDTIFAITCG